MDETTECDSASAAGTKSPYECPEEAASNSSLENNLFERNNDNDLIEDSKQKEQPQHIFESMEDRCDKPETSGKNKMFQRRLMLDAGVSDQPQANRLIPQGDFNTIEFESTVTEVMVNTKVLSKEAKTYELEKFQKNYLIIFNQESIDGFDPRLGTETDVKALTNTFENFGFHVIEYKDYTKDEIIEVLETFKTMNFSDYGCVGVVVLTHGSFNGTLRAKDQTYNETEIIKYFRVYDKPTLVTKPKLLIIQACRGKLCLPGVPVPSPGQLKKDQLEEVVPYTLPVMSDMLVVHSSFQGEASTRDEIHGSWFIQTLCRKINEMSPEYDLESILTEVKREVAAERYWEECNLTTMEMDVYKQMPTVTSTLIRKLYLTKFGDASPPLTYLDFSRANSTNPILDTVSSPILYQFGPCSCFLDHFEYLKRCLGYFVQDNPSDETAQMFLDISKTFQTENRFNASKQKMAKAICKHLIHNAKCNDFFKYLYFYKH